MQLSGDLPRNRTMSTPSPVATRTMSLKDLELHCEQLQVLLGQLRSEKEFVEKENTQLREAMQGEEARSAKISVWLDLERTRQAVRSPHARARHNMTCMRANTVTSHPLRGSQEVQLSESDDVKTVAANVSRVHKLSVAESRAIQEQLQRSYVAMRAARDLTGGNRTRRMSMPARLPSCETVAGSSAGSNGNGVSSEWNAFDAEGGAWGEGAFAAAGSGQQAQRATPQPQLHQTASANMTSDLDQWTAGDEEASDRPECDNGAFGGSDVFASDEAFRATRVPAAEPSEGSLRFAADGWGDAFDEQGGAAVTAGSSTDVCACNWASFPSAMVGRGTSAFADGGEFDESFVSALAPHPPGDSFRELDSANPSREASVQSSPRSKRKPAGSSSAHDAASDDDEEDLPPFAAAFDDGMSSASASAPRRKRAGSVDHGKGVVAAEVLQAHEKVRVAEERARQAEQRAESAEAAVAGVEERRSTAEAEASKFKHIARELKKQRDELRTTATTAASSPASLPASPAPVPSPSAEEVERAAQRVGAAEERMRMAEEQALRVESEKAAAAAAAAENAAEGAAKLAAAEGERDRYKHIARELKKQRDEARQQHHHHQQHQHQQPPAEAASAAAEAAGALSAAALEAAEARHREELSAAQHRLAAAEGARRDAAQAAQRLREAASEEAAAGTAKLAAAEDERDRYKHIARELKKQRDEARQQHATTEEQLRRKSSGGGGGDDDTVVKASAASACTPADQPSKPTPAAQSASPAPSVAVQPSQSAPSTAPGPSADSGASDAAPAPLPTPRAGFGAFEEARAAAPSADFGAFDAAPAPAEPSAAFGAFGEAMSAFDSSFAPSPAQPAEFGDFDNFDSPAAAPEAAIGDFAAFG